MFLVMRIFILKKNYEEKNGRSLKSQKEKSTDTNIININE